ncbi:NAD(P)H nitroreductase [Mycobacterium sp. E342]|uniref:Acg family FMN-binding oxidoreductase n=1 Tax=Mycobacterium sp. E342 TaxID=1834147 RepID=UPI000AE06AB3|nr:NAD(P)H nitroreductase [Mycobacterium sp. E342]
MMAVVQGKTPDVDVLERAVLLACRAPSVHNSQPWRWVIEGDALHLFVDRRRAIAATDSSGREVILSCGAVLNHLCVAMSAAGWEPKVERFPDPGDPDRLASITFSRSERVTEARLRLAEAILQRRTDRLPLGRPTYWDLFEPTLRDSFDDTEVALDVLGEDVRPLLAQASQLTEEIRRDDSYYHAELDWWTSSFALAEGMPPSALASDKESWRVDVARSFPIRSHADRRGEVKADWARILVLSTPQDTRSDVLRCGEVLSTVLLECTVAGMATCPLTHLIELDESRDIVRELIGGRGEPQVLIRVGIAPPMEHLPAATPRRPLGDVLQIR